MLTIQGWLRWAVVRRLLRPAGSVLEIGCGRGALGAILARDHPYVGIEPDTQSFTTAHALLGNMVRQTTDTELTGKFDIVCAFEVLEHIEDDRGALRRWHDLLHPDGQLILSVPAHQRLYGATDRRVGHYRRYSPADLCALLAEAGFRHIEVRTYAFPVGYPLLWIGRLLARKAPRKIEERTASSGRWLQPSPRTAVVRWLTAAPFVILQRPFEHTMLGTGLVAEAHS